MELRAREPVILAADFAALVRWYREALGFRVTRLFEDGFHYGNLETPSGAKLGVASAAEMGVTPGDRRANTVVLQLEVADVRAFLAHVESAGGAVLGGPSFDANGAFWFGSFADPEGNPFWVVDERCP
ncbi:MAG: VOC family protein [Planctomycetes bacterium]|nr:VOC family protein [Planctomycetota bacterium]